MKIFDELLNSIISILIIRTFSIQCEIMKNERNEYMKMFYLSGKVLGFIPFTVDLNSDGAIDKLVKIYNRPVDQLTDGSDPDNQTSYFF